MILITKLKTLKMAKKNSKNGLDENFLEDFFENGTMLYSHQNYEIFHIWQSDSEKNYHEFYI